MFLCYENFIKLCGKLWNTYLKNAKTSVELVNYSVKFTNHYDYYL